MKIYLDNFRGFHDTTLDLANINLFVGENSSGKTSVMAAVDIILQLSTGYLKKREDITDCFNNDDFELGNFEEVSSFYNKPIYLGVQPESVEEMFYLYKIVKSENGFMIENYYGYFEGTLHIVILNDNNHSMSVENKIFFRRITNINLTSLDAFINEVKNNVNFNDYELIEMDSDSYSWEFELDYLIRYRYGQEYLTKKWFAPVRSKPKRIYEGLTAVDSADGVHIPKILFNIWNDKKTIKNLLS